MRLKRRQLLFGIDSPEKKLTFINNSKVLVNGWCVGETGEWPAEVRIELGDRIIYCQLEEREAGSRQKNDFQIACGFKASFKVGRGLKLLHIKAITANGEVNTLDRRLVYNKQRKGIPVKDYATWIAAYDQLHSRDSATLLNRLKIHAYRPLISVLIPVRTPCLAHLKSAIKSVINQSYHQWELWIIDYGPPCFRVTRYYNKLARNDTRIKIYRVQSQEFKFTAPDEAMTLAVGEYVTFMGQEDRLAPQALGWIIDALNSDGDFDLLYTDEDRIDEKGYRSSPQFKPDWNPDFLLSKNYIGHLTVIRKTLVDQAGGCQFGADHQGFWDLLLRCIEKTTPARIRHIPRILYHRRSKLTSTLNENNESIKVLEDFLLRNKVHGEVVNGDNNTGRIRYCLPNPTPKVSIIIPTRDQANILEVCIQSILSKTTYSNYDMTIISNESKEDDTLSYFNKIRCNTIQIVNVPGPFNFSRLVNYGVSCSDGHVIALLNNDTEVISPNWLEEMVSQALRPGIGAVGAKLYYPNNSIQHAGVILGLGGVAGHAFRHFNHTAEGSIERLNFVQNYSAVTAACLVVRRSVFIQVGGFNEKDLQVAYNDIDFCLRIVDNGFRNLFTPYAELYHHESYSRGADDTIEKQLRFQREVEYIQKKWKHFLKNDPAYNPNLTLLNESFELSSPPRLE